MSTTADTIARSAAAREEALMRTVVPVASPGTTAEYITGVLEQQSGVLDFPESALVGSLGDLARLMAQGTEVPEEFYFATALTVLGAICGTRLSLNIAIDCEPRLYTVLLGESADVKKSTALRSTVKFFYNQLIAEGIEIQHGVGSAEGLARILAAKRRVLLCYDELKAFMAKSQIEGAVLLPMITSLFEGNRWSNPTKNAEQSHEVKDGHLSIIGCCTKATYSRMWTPEAIAIGLPNRLFVVSAEREKKVPWPAPPNPTTLDKMHLRIAGQLDRLPLTFDITPEAKALWGAWYESLTNSEHTKRLDTIGFRLLGLIALTTDKTEIDAATVEAVRSILDYEFCIRVLTDPIDADNKIARLEENIRRLLKIKGRCSNAELRKLTNASRDGIWAFDKAVANLSKVGEVVILGTDLALAPAQAVPATIASEPGSSE